MWVTQIMFGQKLIVSHMQVLLQNYGNFFMSDMFVAEKEATHKLHY